MREATLVMASSASYVRKIARVRAKSAAFLHLHIENRTSRQPSAGRYMTSLISIS
jgi:hypothetical protein